MRKRPLLSACLIIFPALLFGMLIAGCSKHEEGIASDADELLRLNQIQIIASHNSYRIITTDTVFSFLQSITALLPPSLDPTELDYTHVSFDAQMTSYGIRGLEIDVYNDPVGGAFSNRKINSFVGLDTASGIAELDQPGFKVLHIKDVDYNTHYFTFRQALIAIRDWSSAHPGHLPLFINVETKSDAPADDPTLASLGFQPAPAYDASSADAIDAEIREVFGQELEDVITPDDLRGNLNSLYAAVSQNSWPTLRQSRGKVVFILEGACLPFYLQGHPSLTGRAMFAYVPAGTPEAAFILLNDAMTDSTSIRNHVEQGYIVRTRCDAGTLEARTGDYSRMNTAMMSGAHILSTDYYKADSRAGQPGWSSYQVKFPESMLARKNPVSAATVDVPEALSD